MNTVQLSSVHWRNPSPADVGESPLAMLRLLGDCSVIDIDGDAQGPVRVVSTLIHGNEPSGIIALHRWLSQGNKARFPMRFIIASVTAALTAETFTHRYLPHLKDLNRCFSEQGNSHVHHMARRIKELIREVRPSHVIDMHNTSGSGPAFAVSITDNVANQALIGQFCQQMILTGLRMGSLMEEEFGCPVVTIECGGCNDPAAHEVAYQGIQNLASNVITTELPLTIMRHPMRIEVRSGARLVYDDCPQPQSDLCILTTIEQYNSQITPAGTHIGWASSTRELLIRDEAGSELPHQLFSVDNHRITTCCALQLFMATTQEEIALNDCLFYAIEIDEEPTEHTWQ